ncbi:unnamed protein product [Dibothriocephalus latus]|uniref:Uncharacterized protein n=1 Tax=Dibothriocephalus latus TaxID=60516 RepID=A0A3P7LIJ2_DIBLA|nr:unnamed protein product [Dibothriocephalus latus]
MGVRTVIRRSEVCRPVSRQISEIGVIRSPITTVTFAWEVTRRQGPNRMLLTVRANQPKRIEHPSINIQRRRASSRNSVTMNIHLSLLLLTAVVLGAWMQVSNADTTTKTLSVDKTEGPLHAAGMQYGYQKPEYRPPMYKPVYRKRPQYGY